MVTKPQMSADERRVFERLKDWADQLDGLMRLYTNTRQMPRERLEEARATYKNLKEKLRAEYQRGATQPGEAEMTAAERRWYQRTVHQAFTQLRAPTNVAPEKWFAGVYSAYSDFRSEMHSMNEVCDIPEEWMQ